MHGLMRTLVCALALGLVPTAKAAPPPPEPTPRGVLLVRGDGDLRVVTRDGTSLRRYDLRSEGLVAGVRGGAAASDGRIAFIGNRREGRRLSDDGLFLIGPGGIEEIEPPGAGVDWSTAPVWSPDGRFLAYRKNQAETWVADLRGGDGHRVRVDAPLVGGLEFTADGKALVADVNAPSSPGHYNERQLVAVPIGGGASQPLTPPSNVQALHPRFSPDGSRIAFLSLAEGGPGLWIAPVGGAPQRIAAAPAGHEHVEGLAWSPDGRWIAVLWGRREALGPGAALVRGTLEIISADGRERHVANRGASAAYDRLTWSPDSRFVAFMVSERGAGGAAVASTNGRVRRAGISRFDAPAWLFSTPPALQGRQSSHLVYRAGQALDSARSELGCTSAFVLRLPTDGQLAGVSAGHCSKFPTLIPAGGSPGDPLVGVTEDVMRVVRAGRRETKSTLGSVLSNPLLQESGCTLPPLTGVQCSGGLDALVFSLTGVPFAAQQIDGWGRAPLRVVGVLPTSDQRKGRVVCFTGRTSGTDQCGRIEGWSTCPLPSPTGCGAPPALCARAGDRKLSRHGDSGAAVYTRPNRRREVRAVGVLARSSIGGRLRDMCYTPIETVLGAFGAELPIGSFSIGPPS